MRLLRIQSRIIAGTGRMDRNITFVDHYFTSVFNIFSLPDWTKYFDADWYKKEVKVFGRWIIIRKKLKNKKK